MYLVETREDAERLSVVSQLVRFNGISTDRSPSGEKTLGFVSVYDDMVTLSVNTTLSKRCAMQR